jgi:hypothetical protein
VPPSLGRVVVLEAKELTHGVKVSNSHLRSRMSAGAVSPARTFSRSSFVCDRLDLIRSLSAHDTYLQLKLRRPHT